MTDIDDLLAKLNTRLTYKDWTFEFARAPDDAFSFPLCPSIMVTWSYPIIDVHTGKHNIVRGRRIVNLTIPYDDGLIEKLLLSDIWKIIMGAETHEAMEQFQVDGIRVYDPHPDGKTAMSPDLYKPNLEGLAMETQS